MVCDPIGSIRRPAVNGHEWTLARVRFEPRRLPEPTLLATPQRFDASQQSRKTKQ